MVTSKDFNAALTVPEAIERRRSIRKYTEEPISHEMILKMISLAGRAPSSNNVQPWRVIAVTDKEKLKELRGYAMDQSQVEDSAVTFVVYSDRDVLIRDLDHCIHPDIPDEERGVRRKNIYDGLAIKGDEGLSNWANCQTNIFLGFLLIVLQSCGYSTSAIGGFEPPKVKKMFGLPDHVQISALVACGRQNEDGYPTYRHEPEFITRFV